MELTEKEQLFMIALCGDYAGVAETANLEYALCWLPKIIGGVGGSLNRKGLVETTHGAGAIMESWRQTGGSIYTATERGFKAYRAIGKKSIIQ